MCKHDLNLIKEQLLLQVSQHFQRLSQGLDVSPAARFRLEGQLELLLQMGVLQRQKLQTYCEQQMQQCGLALPLDGFWQLAQQQGRFFIPAPMMQAPVYKA